MKRGGVDLVALVLALALAITVVLVTITALANVLIVPKSLFSLGENTTQVLTTVLGGIIGLLGTYMGYRLGAGERDDTPPPVSPEEQTTGDWPRITH